MKVSWKHMRTISFDVVIDIIVCNHIKFDMIMPLVHLQKIYSASASEHEKMTYYYGTFSLLELKQQLGHSSNFSFWVPCKKENHTGLERHEGESMMDYFFKPLRQLNAGSELNCGLFLVREYYERYRSHTPCAELYCILF